MPCPSLHSLRGARPASWRVTAVSFAIGLGALVASGASSDASTARASFAVGATVLARTAITGQSVPEVLEVSAADAARGFVELPRAARLSILNTSTAGFALDVLPVGSLLSAVEVEGTGAQVRFDAGGGTIVQRGQRGRDIALDLGFRLALAPGVGAGRYPWPLAFNVRPLAANQ